MFLYWYREQKCKAFLIPNKEDVVHIYTVKACTMCLVVHSYPNLWDPMDCSSPGSAVHGNSPGKNTRVGCHVLLQGIFPAQGFNPGLSHCRQILYLLGQQGASVHGILQARILEWVAKPSFRGSSQPRDQTLRLLCLLHWQASLPLSHLGSPCCSPWCHKELDMT